MKVSNCIGNFNTFLKTQPEFQKVLTPASPNEINVTWEFAASLKIKSLSY